jgi:predicted RNA binding protein YcfA (HicA-like mRNA interferase family)
LSKLPSVSGERLVRALKRAGFEVLRQKGSHVALERRVGEKTFRTIVPQHAAIAKGTLSDMLKQAGLTLEELLELL